MKSGLLLQPIVDSTLYLVDIDGVLTDSNSLSQGVDEAALIAVLRASAFGKLALATGRPFSWVEASILSNRLFSEQLKCEIIVASENGAVISTYCEGEWKSLVNSKVSVSNEVKQAFKDLANSYSDFICFDSEKVAMATIAELSNSQSAKELFQSRKKSLLNELQERFCNHDELRISTSSIAIDACHTAATKRLAASEVISRVGGFKRIVAIGDSSSDGDLALEAKALLPKANVSFYFVGKDSIHSIMEQALRRSNIPLLISKESYSRGVVSLLQDKREISNVA